MSGRFKDLQRRWTPLNLRAFGICVVHADRVRAHEIVWVIVVEVPSVFWIIPKSFNFAKPRRLFRWHSDAGIIGYWETCCAIAVVVGIEDLFNLRDTEFCECRVESSSTRINEERAAPIAENTRVNMSVVDI